MILSTGTYPQNLPTGTIDALSALLVLTKGMPSSPFDIQMPLQQMSEFINLGHSISPSISGNNLVVALKGLNGQDPSTSNPVRFVIGNSFYYLTQATSYTAVSGTNWHNAGSASMAGNAMDFFLYAIAETGAAAGLKFGHSRIPFAETMNDFSSTSTNEKYIKGNYTNFNTSDKVVNIGRFRAQLSSAFNWSISSALVINRPIYESEWSSWSPTTANGGLVGWSDEPTGTIYRYKIFGNAMFAFVRQLNPGTSNSTSLTIAAPMSAASVSGMVWSNMCRIYDNSTIPTIPSLLQITAAAPTVLSAFKDFSAAGFTASGTKGILSGYLVYQI